MHHYQRTVLNSITLLILAVSFALLILHVRQQRYPLSDLNAFLCTTRTVTSVQPGNFHADGNIVLDFKNKRITLQYDIITAQQIKKVLYRDVDIKNLKMPGAGIYTFDVDSVKVFSTDTAGDFLAHFRLLHPGAANEIRVTRVGNSTYLYSINRQIYNVCTLQ